jgi:hypothetical protein
VQPLTDVRDISKLAYGFMATQALVAALDLNLFGLLRDGRDTLQGLARSRAHDHEVVGGMKAAI